MLCRHGTFYFVDNFGTRSLQLKNPWNMSSLCASLCASPEPCRRKATGPSGDRLKHAKIMAENAMKACTFSVMQNCHFALLFVPQLFIYVARTEKCKSSIFISAYNCCSCHCQQLFGNSYNEHNVAVCNSKQNICYWHGQIQKLLLRGLESGAEFQAG